VGTFWSGWLAKAWEDIRSVVGPINSKIDEDDNLGF